MLLFPKKLIFALYIANLAHFKIKHMKFIAYTILTFSIILFAACKKEQSEQQEEQSASQTEQVNTPNTNNQTQADSTANTNQVNTTRVGLNIGDTAPNFTLNTPEGKPISLYALRGKILLVDFWAAWCRPCRMENPNVVAAYEKFKNKGFDVLGVSLDQNKEDWLKAIEKDKLTWTQVSDLKFWDSPVVALYQVDGIPMNFLLDKDGKIIAKNLRGQDLEKTLSQILQ